jgi:phosphatidylglycerol---prolipoprotein diacylglyceryl transferase
MHPYLGTIPTPWGGIPVYTYGVLVAAGVLLGLWYARHYAAVHTDIDPERVWNLGIYMVLGGLVVAKLWYVLSNAHYFWRHKNEIFALATLQSGGTFYGGFIGALAVAAIYANWQRVPALPLLDSFAAGLPLGHAIGRLGCFAAGCCYGKPTFLPWGVTFTSTRAAQLVGTPLNIPLHPTQLYESAAEFFNFFILILLARKQRFRGEIFATFILLYGIERGLIEFDRWDPGRTLFLHGRFSLMQVVSLAMIFVGAWMWRRGSKSSRAAQRTAVLPARQ